MDRTTIYVLRLQGGRFYVGKAEDVRRRIQEHINGHGSAWTRLFRPIAIEDIKLKASIFDEDKITKEYMSLHGTENVRGGSYCQVELPPDQIQALERELRSAKNLCLRCGSGNHLVAACSMIIESVPRGQSRDDAQTLLADLDALIRNQQPARASGDASSSGAQASNRSVSRSAVATFRCGHCDRVFTTAYGRGVHERFCREQNAESSDDDDFDDECYRCGRAGHYRTECFARTHVRGHYLPKR
jgi:predicted GIY-YIG superfamily endonuclease